MSFGPSMIERMSAYQRTTGLKPIGLHRPTADRLLRGVSQRCVHCGGDGYHAVGKSWLWCEACGGLGRLITPKARHTLRRQVVERFPASAVEGVTPIGGETLVAGWRGWHLDLSFRAMVSPRAKTKRNAT